MISKTNLEEAAKKSGHAGLYATFKSYYDEDEDQNVDKGYWGQVNDEEMMEEEEEMIQEEEEPIEQFGWFISESPKSIYKPYFLIIKALPVVRMAKQVRFVYI